MKLMKALGISGNIRLTIEQTGFKKFWFYPILYPSNPLRGDFPSAVLLTTPHPRGLAFCLMFNRWRASFILNCIRDIGSSRSRQVYILKRCQKSNDSMSIMTTLTLDRHLKFRYDFKMILKKRSIMPRSRRQKGL